MRVLVVEDEVRLARAIVKVLSEEGYVADTLANGHAGLAAAFNEPYDIVLLDVMLPGMDGYEVARRLRAGGSKAPIIMLTARDAIRDKIRGLDAGADDYLVKPFALAELLARIRALARRSGMIGDETILRVADLSLDLRTRQAARGDRRIELTTKEFGLLAALMRRPFQVLTRAQLLDQVWGMDALQTESNVVDIYVHYLRNKVDKGFGKKLIHTIRGAGYAIRAD
ncbi:MAG: response regulator transcription factor [Dehalococcoidia bacterium]